VRSFGIDTTLRVLFLSFPLLSIRRFLRFVDPKLVVPRLALSLVGVAWAAAPRFSGQSRIGLTTGDPWEPLFAADGSERLYVLCPHYGPVPDCPIPTMLLVASSDDA